MKRTLLVCCSDLHGGHRHGLLNPDTILDELGPFGQILGDYNPECNPIQKYLWGIYTSQIDAIRQSAGTDEVVLAMLGDMTAGIVHKDRLVSSRTSDQIVIARYNMLPWMDLPTLKHVRFTKGTGVHVLYDGSAEILLGLMVEAYHPDRKVHVADHELLTIDGMTVDMSHHGPPPGSRNWLTGNEVRYYLRSLMMDEFMAGKIPPRLVFRGHYHTYRQETLSLDYCGKTYTSTMVLLPSFTFPNDYARKAVRSPSRITHGMVVSEIVDGELLRVIPLKRTIDIRTKEII